MRQTRHNSTFSKTGFSLIEMSVVISLLGAFSIVGISLINKLMELDTAIASSALHQMTTDRLEDQLRTDAEQAVNVVSTETGFDIVEQDGNLIEYRILEDLLTRKVQRTRNVSKDAFKLLNCELGFEVTPQRLIFFIEHYEPLDQKSMSSQLGTGGDSTVRLIIPMGRQRRYMISPVASGGDL